LPLTAGEPKAKCFYAGNILLGVWSRQPGHGGRVAGPSDTVHTLHNWFNMHCDLCIDWVRANPPLIGGPGHVVQIDESLISKANPTGNRRAQPIAKRWVFRGIDTRISEAFLVEVLQRNTATLLPVLQQHVLPGTTIWSDQWAAYRHIPQVTGLPHQTVNHSLHFVNPGTGVNTNTVENMWRCVKDKFKRTHSTSQVRITSYLQGFLWRRQHSRDDCFESAVVLMRWRYPVPHVTFISCTSPRSPLLRHSSTGDNCRRTTR